MSMKLIAAPGEEILEVLTYTTEHAVVLADYHDGAGPAEAFIPLDELTVVAA